MRLSSWVRARALLVFFLVCAPWPATAQDEPPRIRPFVVDVRGTFPMFGDDAQLAASRGLNVSQLPGTGIGLDVGAHVYLFTWRAVTAGLGGQLTLGRSKFTPPPSVGGSTGPAITERFTSIAPQVSLNFGSGNGWSYISAGLGTARRSIVPDDAAPAAADVERLRTLNYGGGARWFAKPRVAFTFDVRFYAMDPGAPAGPYPGSPRTTFVVIGAGVSVR